MAQQGASQAPSSTVRWVLGVASAVGCAIGLVLLFMLTLVTDNGAWYERHFVWLLGLNIGVAVVLMLVLAWMAVRLLVRWRQRKFGSRLLLKLAAIFALVGVIPGLVIYVVSYQFVSRSIESWFDVKVEGALSAGVNLASVTLETMANDMANNTRTAGQQLEDVSDAGAGLVLERIRDQLGAVDVVLWNSNGMAVASAGDSLLALAPDRPQPQQLRQLRSQQRPLAVIDGLDDLGAGDSRNLSQVRVRTWAVVGSSRVGLLTATRYLQATIPLPTVLLANALAVQDANREYQQRALARGGLKRMYIGTLTLSLFLAVFGAVLLAVLLGNQLARPLLLLAQGVRDVAKGDLTPKTAMQTRDELGGLTRSFAMMTQQLLDARTAVDSSMAEVQAARTNLQTILDNLSAGVLVLDAQLHILISNPGATQILRVPVAAHLGQPLAALPGMTALAEMVHEQFALFLSDNSGVAGRERWQHVFELLPISESSSPQGEIPHDKTTLVVRGAELPNGRRLVVFDDISEIVSAQRSKAWGEVARRVAHEIKNPLTPIQLSAERLSMKLADKLPPTEQALLHKSVKTIVEQVAAMLRLVNEFRDYARLPAADLKPLDLNALVLEILQLYGEENAEVPVQIQLDEGCPRIKGDAQQLRQVIHNLVQNAQDATLQHAQNHGHPIAPVQLSTSWSETSKRVRLSIADNGTGFAPHILQRAFEPYVTTKTRGTGLGLAVVKKIADEHGARIDLNNRTENGVVQGAQVSLSFAPNDAEVL